MQCGIRRSMTLHDTYVIPVSSLTSDAVEMQCGIRRSMTLHDTYVIPVSSLTSGFVYHRW
jgi:hypothetical protein